MSTDAEIASTPHRCEPHKEEVTALAESIDVAIGSGVVARLLADRKALRTELFRVEGINNELVKAGKTVLNPNLDLNKKSAAMTFLAGAQSQTAEEPT